MGTTSQQLYIYHILQSPPEILGCQCILTVPLQTRIYNIRFLVADALNECVVSNCIKNA